MVQFIVPILSFVWRTVSKLYPPEWPLLSMCASLNPCIAITGGFDIGMIFMLIVKTLRSDGTSGADDEHEGEGDQCSDGEGGAGSASGVPQGQGGGKMPIERKG